MKYYGSYEREADFPFNFDLIPLGLSGSELQIGNHDNTRLASRIDGMTDDEKVKISKLFAQLTFTLPG